MRTEHQASRTLVKSPPELWAECSDASSLARHIGEFGEIRITRLQPESSVCWEADNASGTVEIEPSGWGTRVTLTAQTEASEVGAEAGEEVQTAVHPPEAEGDPVEEEEIDATVEETTADTDPAVAVYAGPAGGRWKRLIGRTRRWFRASNEAGVTADPAPASTAEAAMPPERTGLVTPEPPDEAATTDEAATSDAPPAADAGLPDEPVGPAQAKLSDEAACVDPAVVLAAALDSLGQAHHRPFSRA